MAKDKISQYSTTNALNTDIGGIDIDENCLPSNLNDAIREVMVQLREFQDGSSADPLTITGTITGTTIKEGTANIVSQADIGTAPNEIPMNQYLGNLAYQDAGSIAGDVGVGGVVRDANGNIRAVPKSGATKTTSYTLTTADVGDFIEIGTGGSITIPNSTFATGDILSLFNNTSGDITITCTITTAYLAGTDADKATVTLATRGVATLLFISGTVCVISGNVT